MFGCLGTYTPAFQFAWAWGFLLLFSSSTNTYNPFIEQVLHTICGYNCAELTVLIAWLALFSAFLNIFFFFLRMHEI